jgi:hypothetical protein
MAEAVVPQVMTTADGTPLKVSLNRALRRNKLRAFLWVAPLLAFISVSFLIPILDMVFRGVENPVIGQVLPNTVPLLQDWDETSNELPGEEVYAALLEDVKIGKENKTIGKVGQLLNYQEPGMSSVFRSSPRKFAKITEAPYKEQMIEAHKKWGDLKTWRVIKQHSDKFTSAYFLAAMDLKRDVAGSVVRQPEERRIYIKLFIRTLVLSTVYQALHPHLGVEHGNHRLVPGARLSDFLPARDPADQEQQSFDDPGPVALLDFALGTHLGLDRALAARGRHQRPVGLGRRRQRRQPSADDPQSDRHRGGDDPHPPALHGAAAL